MGERGKIPKSAFEDAKKPCKGVGQAPIYLSRQAKLYYDHLAKLLAERLEPEDETILAECAQSMAEIAMVNAMLTTAEDYTVMGSQGPTVSPYVRVRALAQKAFLSASTKLGLSPVDRHRLLGKIGPVDEGGGPGRFDDDGEGGSA